MDSKPVTLEQARALVETRRALLEQAERWLEQVASEEARREADRLIGALVGRREALGMGVQELARRQRCKVGLVEAREAGQIAPTQHVLSQWAGALGGELVLEHIEREEQVVLPEDPVEVAARLRQLREQAGISQAELARLQGVSTQIQNIREAGRAAVRGLHLSGLILWTRALGYRVQFVAAPARPPRTGSRDDTARDKEDHTAQE